MDNIHQLESETEQQVAALARALTMEQMNAYVEAITNAPFEDMRSMPEKTAMLTKTLAVIGVNTVLAHKLRNGTAHFQSNPGKP